MEKLNRMTFWQVLIAGLILVVIAMLLLPAIQASRESAQITRCRENLRRIGLAMHSYVEAYNGFPLGITSINLDIGDIENESRSFMPRQPDVIFPSGLAPAPGRLLLPYLRSIETHSAYNMRPRVLRTRQSDRGNASGYGSISGGKCLRRLRKDDRFGS